MFTLRIQKNNYAVSKLRPSGALTLGAYLLQEVTKHEEIGIFAEQAPYRDDIIPIPVLTGS